MDYGVDAFAFHDWLASPDVTGTPAGGLEAGGTASGMAGYNVAAGVKGELSVAHMLASMDLKGARVYRFCFGEKAASSSVSRMNRLRLSLVVYVAFDYAFAVPSHGFAIVSGGP